jgi:RNA polymerase sigma factor (sigma-70 family)
VDPCEAVRAVGEAAVEYQADLSFRLGPELSSRLRLAAHTRRWAPEILAAELLTRGLDQEPDRVRAQAALRILTPRERDVTRLTVLGLTNHEIAYELGISSETVKSHVRSTLAKLALHSKSELRLLVYALDPWDEESDR